MRQTNKTCFSCLTHQVILILVQACMFHLCSKFLLLIEAEIHTYVVTRFHIIVAESFFNIVGYQWNLDCIFREMFWPISFETIKIYSQTRSRYSVCVSAWLPEFFILILQFFIEICIWSEELLSRVVGTCRYFTYKINRM